MRGRGRLMVATAGLLLATAGLAGCSGTDTDDPVAVAAAMLNAVADSNCKAVQDLYPTAGEDGYPAEDCTNEMAGDRAIGTYRCEKISDLKQTATVSNVSCRSEQEPDKEWDLVLERDSEGWVVTAAG